MPDGGAAARGVTVQRLVDVDLRHKTRELDPDVVRCARWGAAARGVTVQRLVDVDLRHKTRELDPDVVRCARRGGGPRGASRSSGLLT